MNEIRPWIRRITVKSVRHLSGFVIDIATDQPRTLMITGSNGIGKTSLIEALWMYLTHIERDKSLEHCQVKAALEGARFAVQKGQENDMAPQDLERNKNNLEYWERKCWLYFREMEVELVGDEVLSRLCKSGDFIIAFYRDFRSEKFVSPKNPEKPNLDYDVEKSKVGEFLKYLVDMKVQQALAKNEGVVADAAEIGRWFEDFERILKRIFDDVQLALHFDYKTYVFEIESKGRRFPFTGLSAGYSAILNIVADLMLKMRENRPVCVFNKPGIVLVDEVETHLHLALQKEVMPILSSLFPNVQWIVTSHSPFVINSVGNALVFDLEHKTSIDDAIEYSYDSLAEGFFGVDIESSELKRQLSLLEELIHSNEPRNNVEIERIMANFDRVPQVMAPRIIARYSELKLEYYSKRTRA